MADYLIKGGDTLAKIAAQYNVSIDTLLKLNPEIKDANSIMAGKSLKISGGKAQKRNDAPINGTQIEKNETQSKQNKRYSSKDIAIGGIIAGAAWKLGNDLYGAAKMGAANTGHAALKVAKKLPGKVTNIANKAKVKARAMVHSMKTTGDKIASYSSAKYHSAVEAGKAKAKTYRNKIKRSSQKVTGKVVNIRNKALNKAKNLVANIKSRAVNVANKAGTMVKTGLGKGKGILSKAKVFVKQSTGKVVNIGKAVKPMSKAMLKSLKAAAPTLKALGKVAKPVGAAVVALDVLEAHEKGGAKAAKRQAIISGSGFAGGIAGSVAAGAALGSVLPIGGTIIGGIIGGIIGWWAAEETAKALL